MNKPKMSISLAADFLGISTQAVHKQLKTKDITCKKSGNKMYLTFTEAKKLFNINFEHKVIVSHIVKGGTGKTTIIDNIANCANAYGAKVLKIDLDPQGNLTDANGVDDENIPTLIDILTNDVSVLDCIIHVCDGMDLIPSSIENVICDNVIVNNTFPIHTLFADILENIKHNYDFIFIDCPPTIGATVTAAYLYADVILAPLNPDRFSAKGLKILKSEVNNINRKFKSNIEFKVFLNKFSNRTILSDKAVAQLISDPELEGKVLSSTVQFSQELPNITDEGKSIFSSLKNSTTRDDLNQLTKELLAIRPEKAQKDNNVNAIEFEEETSGEN